MTDITPTVQLMDIRNADKDRDTPEHMKWWYVTLQALLAKDPTLSLQLDVGPPPGRLSQLDKSMLRMQQCYAIFVKGFDHPWRGITGCYPHGVVMDRAPIFASVAARDYKKEPELREDDILILSEGYKQMGEYLMENCNVRGVQAICIPNSMHSDALHMADFSEAGRIPNAARSARQSNSDVLIFVKG